MSVTMTTKNEIYNWIKINIPKVIIKQRIQSIKEAHYSVIYPMFKKSVLFKHEDYFIKKHKDGINGLCFDIASYLWMKNHNHHNLKLCVGLARTNKKFYWHAWLVDKNNKTLIEPTDLIRENYYGVCLTRRQSIIFVKDRIDTIACLNLRDKKYKVTNQMLIDLL
jgi:hypothetical protein